MMKIDEEQYRVLVDLVKMAIQDGTETISIGDLDYAFPDVIEDAQALIDKEIK